LAKGRALAVLIAAVLTLGAGGCGGGGVAKGATVTVYADAPLCAGAGRELADQGGRAGSIRVRLLCLKSVRQGARLDLATVGANARRATEDSASVAYIESPSRPSFSRPILESAGVAWISSNSGAAGMARLMHAIQGADPGSLRESVREALHETG
jgi:hypothetical protein